MLNGEILTDGLFNIKPGRIGVCPVLDILKLVVEEVVVKIWCMEPAILFGFLECRYFDPGPFAFPVRCIDY